MLSQWLPTDFPNFDLEQTTPKEMVSVQEKFREWSEQHPLQPHGLKDGWHDITPAIAENLLRRNPEGANRKLSIATVKYYARQMKAKNGWKRTGQPIIISDKDTLLDSQHRCWAGYLSGVSFPSYVVTNVEHIDNVFAYIDNGKARNPKDALQTAGVNGIAAKIAQAIKIGRDYDANAFRVEEKDLKTAKLTPIEVLETVMANPLVIEAAHQQLAEEFDEANELIHHGATAIFVAWKIRELYGEEMLADFMAELSDSETGSTPVIQLRKKLLADQNADKSMRKSLKLGYIIRAFNAWRTNESLTRLTLRAEEYPKFGDVSEREAA